MPNEKTYYAKNADIHINYEEIPEFEIDNMCRTISAAIHRLMQDPKNKENFEQWRKARASGDITIGVSGSKHTPPERTRACSLSF